MVKVLTCMVAVMAASAAWAQQEADFAAMMKAFAGAAQAQPAAGAGAMVSPKALKEALPKALPGFDRVEAGSEKQSAFGISTVIATGVYESGEKSIRIELTDMGGLGGLGAMAMMGMANSEVDKETRSGFERTTTYQGFKALEKFDKTDNSGEIEVYVGGRFSAKISGSSLAAFDELATAAKAIDLKALSELKPEPAQ